MLLSLKLPAAMDEKKKETVKLYTEILKVIAVLFGGTAAGLASLISRGWTSAREVFLVVTGIICVLTFGLLFVSLFRITKNLLK